MSRYNLPHPIPSLLMVRGEARRSSPGGRASEYWRSRIPELFVRTTAPTKSPLSVRDELIVLFVAR